MTTADKTARRQCNLKLRLEIDEREGRKTTMSAIRYVVSKCPCAGCKRERRAKWAPQDLRRAQRHLRRGRYGLVAAGRLLERHSKYASAEDARRLGEIAEEAWTIMGRLDAAILGAEADQERGRERA